MKSSYIIIKPEQLKKDTFLQKNIPITANNTRWIKHKIHWIMSFATLPSKDLIEYFKTYPEEDYYLEYGQRGRYKLGNTELTKLTKND